MVTVLPRKPWQWTPIALTYQTGTGGIVCPCWPWKLKENLRGGERKKLPLKTEAWILCIKRGKRWGEKDEGYRRKKNSEPFVSWRGKTEGPLKWDPQSGKRENYVSVESFIAHTCEAWKTADGATLMSDGACKVHYSIKMKRIGLG